MGMRIVGGKFIPNGGGEVGAFVAAIFPGGVAEQLHGELREGTRLEVARCLALDGGNYGDDDDHHNGTGDDDGDGADDKQDYDNEWTIGPITIIINSSIMWRQHYGGQYCYDADGYGYDQLSSSRFYVSTTCLVHDMTRSQYM